MSYKSERERQGPSRRDRPRWKVIQFATGNVGRLALQGILDHPDLELVGVWVHSPDKAGRDAGEL